MRYLITLLLSLLISCGGSGSTAYDTCFYWSTCSKTVLITSPNDSNAKMCYSKASECAIQCTPKDVKATDCETRSIDINTFCSQHVKSCD